jgi:hypothetical protein
VVQGRGHQQAGDELTTHGGHPALRTKGRCCTSGTAAPLRVKTG